MMCVLHLTHAQESDIQTLTDKLQEESQIAHSKHKYLVYSLHIFISFVLFFSSFLCIFHYLLLVASGIRSKIFHWLFFSSILSLFHPDLTISKPHNFFFYLFFSFHLNVSTPISKISHNFSFSYLFLYFTQVWLLPPLTLKLKTQHISPSSPTTKTCCSHTLRTLHVKKTQDTQTASHIQPPRLHHALNSQPPFLAWARRWRVLGDK